MRVLFLADDCLWGRYDSHKGFQQGLAFAKFILHSNNNVEDFIVAVIEEDGTSKTYSILEYIETFDKEENQNEGT